MKLFKKVAIIGVGLIGGSIGLAIKKKGLACEVVGVGRHRKNLLLAKKRHAIDNASRDIGILSGADLVILAMPVSAILELAPKISGIISSDSIVSDVGSTKQEIVSRLGKLFPNYVGAHPLAGSEKQGSVNSQGDLFKGSLCILTPTKNTSRPALVKIKQLWRKLGAEVITLSGQEHDKILSFVSHLPHIAAFSLVNSVPSGYLRFASGGFKDTTRIASSDNRLWRDIFLTNRKYLIRAIESFQNNLSVMKQAIIKEDAQALDRILKRAKAKRDAL